MGDSNFLSLDAVLRQHEASRHQLATKLLYDAAQALSVMHSSGIVHGDLRCEHILVSPNLQTVSLSGLDHSFDSNALRHYFMASGKTAAEAGVSVSSATRWLAPECVAGGIPTPASDMYAFGLTVYEALTGSVPFEAKSDEEVVELKKRRETQLPDPRPDKIGRDAWSLIEDACHHNSIFRPSIQLVVMTLRNIHTTAPAGCTAPGTKSVVPIVTPTSFRAVVAPMPPGVVGTYPPGAIATSPPAYSQYQYPTSQPISVQYQYPTGQAATTAYYYPPTKPVGSVNTFPQAESAGGKILPAGNTNPPPAYTARPTHQSSSNPTPRWKKLAWLVVVMAIVAGIAVPTSLFSTSSSSSSDNDSDSPTPTPTSKTTPMPKATPTSSATPTTTPNATRSSPSPSTAAPSRVVTVSTILDAVDFVWMSAVTVGPDGTIYCSDISAIYSLRDDGSQFKRIAGADYGYQNGVVTDARIGRAEGLVVDKQGNLLVGDSDNHRLRVVKLNAVPPTVEDAAGDGADADRDGTRLGSSFKTLTGIALDKTKSNLYATTVYSGIIRKVGLSQDVVSTLGANNLHIPDAIAISPLDNAVYVVTNAKHILRISSDGSSSTVVAGNIINGYLDGVGEDARFQQIVGIAFSPSGEDLYVSDTGNNCIRNLKIATLAVTTIVGACASSPEHQDGDRWSARFANPRGIAVGPDGTIYVADMDHHNPRLRRIKLA